STTRKGEGTGIGLALAKEMVELLGGQIKVESKVGRGTAFEISLPVTRNAPLETDIRKDIFVAMPAPENLPKKSKACPDTPNTMPAWPQNEKPLLLIIEDNPDVIEYLQACLGTGYRFLTARNGKEGVETALEKVPDIVISDVMMPEMDGFGVCEKLKNDPRTSHVPIILLTARARVEDRIAGLSHGADAYLAKPFNKEELCVRLDKLVALRKQMQEHFTNKNISEKSEPDSPEEAFLQRLVAIIHEHLGEEDFNVPRLCRSIAMSRTQLHRKIKALTGQSTTEYVRNTRLREAKRLLETTGMSVSEVAYQTGFRHPNNFSTAFKNYFGHSPGGTNK
ncbi:MAG TPA: response regulator, partial [Bacteroidetes bacterium]|nr:response regulator [Bacteroidota bacterium]